MAQYEAEPPTHLSDKAKAVWRAAVPSQVRCLERLTLLTVGLEAFDRAEQARQTIEREGMTTKTERTGVLHVHPLLRVEKDSRATFVRVWESLDFHQMEIPKPN